MQPNQANIAAMGQTARASATIQGTKPGGPLGVLAELTPTAEVSNQTAQQAVTNPGGTPGTGAGVGPQNIASGQATGLIAGQMMNRRL